MNYANVLMAIVLLVAGTSAANTVMENEQVLDTRGYMILRWTIVNGTGDIEMEFQANCTGWLGINMVIGELDTPGARGDIIMAGYNDARQEGYVQDRWIDLSVSLPIHPMDDVSDVLLKEARYEEPWTIVRVSRSLNTGDETQDIPILPGSMVVEWAFADTDDTDVPHPVGDRGSTFVTFIQSPANNSRI